MKNTVKNEKTREISKHSVSTFISFYYTADHRNGETQGRL